MTFDPATYVEGVPVKIAEKFRPPRKVILSPSCNYQINTEILTDEYDFGVENDILKFLNDQRKYREDALRQRQNNIKEYEEHIRKKREEVLIQQKLQEEEEQRVEEDRKIRAKFDAIKKEEDHFVKEITEESQSEDDKLTGMFDKQNCTEIVPENNESEDVSSSNEQINNSEFQKSNCNSSLVNENLSKCSKLNIYSQQMYPSVLVPTQCTPQTTHERSPTNRNSSINFADFEGDASDPFDSAALKSINDMEELAQILQTSNTSNNDKSFTGAKGPYTNLNYHEPSQYPNEIYPNSQFSYVNYQQPNNQFNHVPLYGIEKATHNNTSVPLSLNPDISYQSFPMQTYTPWNNLNSGSNDPVKYQYNQFCYQMPQNSTVPNASIRTGAISNTVASISSECQLNGIDKESQILPQSSQNPNSNTAISLNKRQDLEDFYIRYYSHHKQQTGFRSGESTPTTNLQGPKTMRSSSSVPDLSAAEDSEVLNIVSTFETLKLNFNPSISNPSSRPSSTVGIEDSHNIPYTKISASPSTVQSRLHDPFIELTNDAQALVQSMAEMGFPRPRVARAVQKLGTDHKKLLEVLLILQSLQESGEDEYRSESAFYFYMGDITKVQDFLTAAKTLLDLGFDEDTVIENLFKHQNDKNKCLEELIS